MRHVMPIFHRAACNAVADILRQFGDVDAVGSDAGVEGEGGGAVDVAVFVEAEAEDGSCLGVGDAGCCFVDGAGEGFGVAEA